MLHCAWETTELCVSFVWQLMPRSFYSSQPPRPCYALANYLQKRAEEREIVNVPTVEFYRNACRVDRLEQPTKEKVWKHAMALKELKLTEGGFLTNIFPGSVNASSLINIAKENWAMTTIFRLVIILAFAMLCYNMFEYYCPQFSASNPIAAYLVVLLSVFVSKRILNIISHVFQPTFQTRTPELSPNTKTLARRWSIESRRPE